MPLAMGAFLYDLTIYIDEVFYYQFSAESIEYAAQGMWKDVVLFLPNVLSFSKFTEIFGQVVGVIKTISDMDKLYE